ncbi:MAG: hypothetical protein HQL17_08005 [Candidatus Omnitrophica bacterium]|nr:hypothetical protein [Candidatus Omnitrophota bacterium]
MKKISFYLIIFAMFVSGCMWPFGSTRKVAGIMAPKDSVSFEVIDAQALSQGGKLYMKPFVAGVDAEAGDALDRLALLMVKGLSDGLAEDGKFTLVTGDDASQAGFIIKGHIEQFKTRGKIKKVAAIKVRADVRLASTDQVVALIYAQDEVVCRMQNVDMAFYDIGSAIAAKLLK